MDLQDDWKILEQASRAVQWSAVVRRGGEQRGGYKGRVRDFSLDIV